MPFSPWGSKRKRWLVKTATRHTRFAFGKSGAPTGPPPAAVRGHASLPPPARSTRSFARCLTVPHCCGDDWTVRMEKDSRRGGHVDSSPMVRRGTAFQTHCSTLVLCWSKCLRIFLVRGAAFHTECATRVSSLRELPAIQRPPLEMQASSHLKQTVFCRCSTILRRTARAGGESRRRCR